MAGWLAGWQAGRLADEIVLNLKNLKLYTRHVNLTSHACGGLQRGIL